MSLVPRVNATSASLVISLVVVFQFGTCTGSLKVSLVSKHLTLVLSRDLLRTSTPSLLVTLADSVLQLLVSMLILALQLLPPPARVLMFRVVDESRDPRLMRRVIDVAVQTDLLPEVGHATVQTDLLPEVLHAAVQCDVSSFGGFDGRVHCELGDPNSGLSVRTLEVILSYSDKVCSVARVLEYQRQLLLDAARTMHDHLDLIRTIDEPLRTAPVLPVVSTPGVSGEVKGSMASDSSDSDVPGEAAEQVEYFQNWVRPVAPLSPPRPCLHNC